MNQHQTQTENLHGLRSDLGLILKYAFYFLPFVIYLFFGSDSPLTRLIFIVYVVILIAAGVWELWQGVLSRQNKKISDGFTKVAFGLLGLFATFGLIDGNWFFFLTFLSVGISLLIEKSSTIIHAYR